MGRYRRENIPDKVYFLSRRCTRRYFLFTPDTEGVVKQLFFYCLGVAAALHGIQVCAVCLMSSHYHLVVADRHGRLSPFLRDFNGFLALAMKAYRGWPEEVFNKAQTSAVELLNSAAVIKEAAYTMANPPTSLAVRYAKDWPGAITRPKEIGTHSFTVERVPFLFPEVTEEETALEEEHPWNPADYRDEEGKAFKDEHYRRVPMKWPTKIELSIEMPDIVLDDMPLEEAQKRMADKLRNNERKAWDKAKELNASFLGPHRVLRQHHTRRARSYETFGSRNPRFSAAGDLQAALDAIAKNRAFNEQYDDALQHWRNGDRRRAVFPYGTWAMRVYHNARCRPPP